MQKRLREERGAVFVRLVATHLPHRLQQRQHSPNHVLSTAAHAYTRQGKEATLGSAGCGVAHDGLMRYVPYRGMHQGY